MLLLLLTPLSASLNTLSLSKSLIMLEPRSVVLRFVEEDEDMLCGLDRAMMVEADLAAFAIALVMSLGLFELVELVLNFSWR